MGIPGLLARWCLDVGLAGLAKAAMIATITLLCIGSMGCSKDLSRGRASDLIEKHKEFSGTMDQKVAIGKCWFDWRDVKDFYGDLAPYKTLRDQGLLTFRETGQDYAVWWKEYEVVLTPQGQEVAKNWIKTSEQVASAGLFGGPKSDAVVYRIPLAERKLANVTGITSDPSGKEAVAEFEWKWQPTAAAKYFPSMVPAETHKAVAAFQLYDDGWRLQELSFR